MFRKVYRDGKATVEGLSRSISGAADRLDQMAPSVEPYRSELEKHDTTVIDLTKLKSGDALNHGKFAESPDAVSLIGDRLVTGQTVTDQDVGVGKALGAVAIGAAQTVGTASIAVSAPIAVFDPRTRRSYGDQVQCLGRSLYDTVGLVGDSVDPALFDNHLALPQSSKSTASPVKNR